jgi:putative FmdB family regulatory protein
MPIHEYRCEECDHVFETLVRSDADVPRCPTCRTIKLTKLFSVPAAAQTNGVGSSLPIRGNPMGGGCGMGGCGSGMCAME